MNTQQRQAIKRKYGWLYETLVQLLANYDLMNLVKHGAPPDEYDIEAAMILERINEVNSPTALARLIYEVFTQCFDKSTALPLSKCEKRRYEDSGKAVWDAWQRWKKSNETEKEVIE